MWRPIVTGEMPSKRARRCLLPVSDGGGPFPARPWRPDPPLIQHDDHTPLRTAVWRPASHLYEPVTNRPRDVHDTHPTTPVRDLPQPGHPSQAVDCSDIIQPVSRSSRRAPPCTGREGAHPGPPRPPPSLGCERSGRCRSRCRTGRAAAARLLASARLLSCGCGIQVLAAICRRCPNGGDTAGVFPLRDK